MADNSRTITACYGIQNADKEWFTGDSRTGAGFTTIAVSCLTCRYTHDHAERIVAQLARNNPPVHATIHSLPPLTDAEVQERNTTLHSPRTRRARRA